MYPSILHSSLHNVHLTEPFKDGVAILLVCKVGTSQNNFVCGQAIQVLKKLQSIHANISLLEVKTGEGSEAKRL